MTATRTVLVTGVSGAGIGGQILKSLRMADRRYRIVGADAQPHSLGLQDADVPLLLPFASAPEYVETVLNACDRLGVEALYPGSEGELLVLAKARQTLTDAGVVLMANTDQVIDTGLDKLATAKFLEATGFRSPRSVLIASGEELEQVPFLPAILKPNSQGGGSVNTFVAQDRDELRLFGTYLLATYEDGFLAQEYVGDAQHEYTVGVLSDLDGAFINSIAVRRDIMSVFNNRSRVKNRTGDPTYGPELVISNGVSQGHIGPYPEVTAVCEEMAHSLDSRGPLNIQLRLVGDEVYVFEINPRFSGTAPLRALVGMNEPDLLYRRHVEGENLTARAPYRSGYIARGLREVLVDPALEEASVGAGDFVWEIPALPFIYRPLEAPHNDAGLPDQLPFTVTVDAGTGLVQQRRRPEVAEALERAYSLGSEIPGRMAGHGIGKEYADDFLAILGEALGTSSLEGKSVLEIGCGNGYLLSRIQEIGAKVQGIEPGAHAIEGSVVHDVPIVRGLFPSPEITEKYDLIVLYLVLEHLPDPTDFLADVRGQLAAGGRVVVVVPDAQPFLEDGDISTLFHEHYSYFTERTLSSILFRAGACDLDVRHSPLSNLLFALFAFETEAPESSSSLAPSLELAHRFRSRVTHTSAQLAAYVSRARLNGESLGIYVPGRFVNYVIAGGMSTQGLRFFDDSADLHGRYYPGIPVVVENQDELVAQPCDRVLVMSKSFGAAIKSRLESRLPAETKIDTLDELQERA